MNWRESLFVKHLRLQKGLLLAASVAMLAEALVIVAMPLPMRFIMNHLLVPTKHGKSPWPFFLPQEWPDTSLLAAAAAWLAVLCVAAALVDISQELWLARAVNRVIEGVRRDLLELLLTRRADFVEGRHKADIIGRLSGDTSNLEGLLTVGLPTLLRALPTLLLVLAVLATLDRSFALAMLAVVLVMYLLTAHFTRRVRSLEKEARNETNYLEEDAYQALQAFPLIKSLSAERATSELLAAGIRRITTSTTGSQVAESWQSASLTATKNFMRLMILLCGGWAVLRRDMLVGDLVLFLSYVDSVTSPVNDLAKFSVKRAKAVIAMERIEELAREARVKPETEGDAEVDASASLALRLREASASYPGGKTPVRDFSAAFVAGDLVAVVGMSGSGKTTFLRLLNRLLDPSDGEIRLGGRLLTDYRLDALRAEVTAVSQQTYFIAGTVRQNLCLARRGPVADGELWSALERVGAEAFVRALPGGLDAAIGEGGLKLSGGEERRLSVARAFLRPRRGVFAFDEPTAGLDPVSAARVTASLRDLAKDGAAVFWSTHRMEEAVAAGRVVFFRAGERPVMGAHAELLATCPSYGAFINASERVEARTS